MARALTTLLILGGVVSMLSTSTMAQTSTDELTVLESAAKLADRGGAGI